MQLANVSVNIEAQLTSKVYKYRFIDILRMKITAKFVNTIIVVSIDQMSVIEWTTSLNI